MIFKIRQIRGTFHFFSSITSISPATASAMKNWKKPWGGGWKIEWEIAAIKHRDSRIDRLRKEIADTQKSSRSGGLRTAEAHGRTMDSAKLHPLSLHGHGDSEIAVPWGRFGERGSLGRFGDRGSLFRRCALAATGDRRYGRAILENLSSMNFRTSSSSSAFFRRSTTCTR
jgi:hypothetical protein